VLGQLPRGDRDLERPRNPGDNQVGVTRAVADQGVDGPLEEPL
jgi:hypothetical protein